MLSKRTKIAIQGILLAAVVAALPTFSSLANGPGGMSTLSDAVVTATPNTSPSPTVTPEGPDDGWD